MKIAVLGAGAYGIALGEVLKENGYNVCYFDPKIIDSDLGDVLDGAEYMVLCAPSEVAPELLKILPKDIPLIVATKGFLTEKVFEVFEDYMILSGAGFADDIKDKKKTKLTATDDRIIELFSNDFLSFDKTDDKLGVLICGALKNVYAIYAGLLRIKPDSQKHKLYLDNVTDELKAILVANGAKAETAELSCGKGDIDLTCGSRSRNYEFGESLRKNTFKKSEKTIEGIPTLKRVRNGEIVVPKTAKILQELMRLSKKWD